MYPIYAKLEDKALAERLDRVKDLIREIERETAFLGTKQPVLVAVPAPQEDCMSIGDISVYGVSVLTAEQREALKALIDSFD